MSGFAPIAKLAVHVATVAGVSKVIGDVIKNNTNVETTADMVKVWTGSFVLGSMVVDQASKHVGNQMTSVADWYNKRKDEQESATEEPVSN